MKVRDRVDKAGAWALTALLAAVYGLVLIPMWREGWPW